MKPIIPIYTFIKTFNIIQYSLNLVFGNIFISTDTNRLISQHYIKYTFIDNDYMILTWGHKNSDGYMRFSKIKTYFLGDTIYRTKLSYQKDLI